MFEKLLNTLLVLFVENNLFKGFTAIYFGKDKSQKMFKKINFCGAFFFN